MSDSLFPSGPWTGFYNYHPGDRHRMDLHLTFANGKMSGEGNDDVGRFLVKGRYDAVSRECYWTKTYVGAHDVFYHGFREGKGIWGTWEINIFGHGGFHIWPRHSGDGEADSESAAQVEPVDAIATEAAPQPADAMKVEECARCLSNPRVTVTGSIAALGDGAVRTSRLAGTTCRGPRPLSRGKAGAGITADRGRKSCIGLRLRLPARLGLNNLYRSKP